MFKLYEKDKCVTVQLNLSATGITDIVPGTILVDDTDGVRPVVIGEDSIDSATAGNYYLAADYYNNTMIYSAPTSDEVPAESFTKGSGKLAAVPIMENFNAVVKTDIDLSKHDLLTIKLGAFAVAASTDLVIAMVTEDNNNTTQNVVDTKITTVIHRHVVV